MAWRDAPWCEGLGGNATLGYIYLKVSATCGSRNWEPAQFSLK
jgi:hypothetical protein